MTIKDQFNGRGILDNKMREIKELNNLAGLKVSRVYVDNRIGFWFLDEKIFYELVFGESVTYTCDVSVRFDVTKPDSLRSLFQILWKKVASVSIGDDWSFRLQFDDKSFLFCPADPKYEAWEISNNDGFQLNCPPYP